MKEFHQYLRSMADRISRCYHDRYEPVTGPGPSIDPEVTQPRMREPCRGAGFSEAPKW